MLVELTDVPQGVIGFELSGTIRAEDYRAVLVPAIERAVAAGELRIVLVIPKFSGMTGNAVWEDLKVGVEHFGKWKRIALVTDIQWMTHLTELFGWLTPGETRVFSMTERVDALAWAAG